MLRPTGMSWGTSEHLLPSPFSELIASYFSVYTGVGELQHFNDVISRSDVVDVSRTRVGAITRLP